MTMKTRNGKTLNDVLSKARARFNWLDKLKKNCSDKLNRLGDVLALPRNVYDAPATNVLNLDYIGETNAAAVVAARQRIEKVFGVPLDENNSATVKCKRITMTFTIKGLPAVTVSDTAAAA